MKTRRHWWLRDLSVVLAVILEVLPTEWDCMLPLLQQHQFVAAFLFKMGCTTVVLLPLVLF
ncbi:MAG TPA: hypothetical protein VFA18_01215, partial [Gemmataceae bacterium]|nr:hypothetical protein [Gemmataceae bacterium]